MLKQKIETYNMESTFKKNGTIVQINEIIENLNSEGKRVISVNYWLGQLVMLLYEYEE